MRDQARERQQVQYRAEEKQRGKGGNCESGARGPAKKDEKLSQRWKYTLFLLVIKCLVALEPDPTVP
jgi:hypothetical protein